MQHPSTSTISNDRLACLLSRERLGAYIAHGGDFNAGVGLYRWNATVSAAVWSSLGHVEVALRNAMSDSLVARHTHLGREGSWLDDPAYELDARMRARIAAARRRVVQRGKCPTDGQTISELGFGFWRFLITRRRTAQWPDLAAAFPNAPDRRRETVEEPVARLHELRNASRTTSGSGIATRRAATRTCCASPATSTPICRNGSCATAVCLRSCACGPEAEPAQGATPAAPSSGASAGSGAKQRSAIVRAAVL